MATAVGAARFGMYAVGSTHDGPEVCAEWWTTPRPAKICRACFTTWPQIKTVPHAIGSAGAQCRRVVATATGQRRWSGPPRCLSRTRCSPWVGACRRWQEGICRRARRVRAEIGAERPDARLVLSDPDPIVLVVHAAALLAVVDHASGARPLDRAVSGQEVLAALLRHEARYWVRSAAGRDLNLDVSVLRIAVAVGCLIGADSEASAGALLSCIPDLDSAERCGRVARWLHDLYPTPYETDPHEREWLGPLRPDLLAEQFITTELTRRLEVITPVFTGLSEARGARALTILARAALTQESALSLLRGALAADLDHLAVPACSVAVETNPVLGELLSQVLSHKQLPSEALIRVAAAIPYPSIALAAPAALVLQRLADDSADDSVRARRLTGLSNRLGDLGRREQALTAIEEAAGIYRQLAQDDPDAFLGDLAAALNNQNGRLLDLGRHEEALAAIKEAVTIRRQLAQDHLADLAMSLNNQSVCTDDLGRREESLTAIEEAVGIYRQLAQGRPDAFLSYLAGALSNQSLCLSHLGRHEEALPAAEEAAAIYRQLAQARPDAFLPNVALALNNQSNPVRPGTERRGPGRDRGGRDHLPRARPRPPRCVPARPRHDTEQPVAPPGRRGTAPGGPDHDRRSGHDPSPAGPGPPRCVPPRPRHRAEQPVQSPV